MRTQKLAHRENPNKTHSISQARALQQATTVAIGASPQRPDRCFFFYRPPSKLFLLPHTPYCSVQHGQPQPSFFVQRRRRLRQQLDDPGPTRIKRICSFVPPFFFISYFVSSLFHSVFLLPLLFILSNRHTRHPIHDFLPCP